MIKSPLVVNASLMLVSIASNIHDSFDSPADTMLLELPSCGLLPIEDITGMDDVVL
jgi:hypothetical protein